MEKVWREGSRGKKSGGRKNARGKIKRWRLRDTIADGCPAGVRAHTNIHYKTWYLLLPPQTQNHVSPSMSTRHPAMCIQSSPDLHAHTDHVAVKTRGDSWCNNLDLPRDAVSGHLACFFRSSFLPGHQVHFIQATLVLHVAGNFALIIGHWMDVADLSEIFICTSPGLSSQQNLGINFLLFYSFSFLLTRLGCLTISLLHRTFFLSILRSYRSRVGHQTNPEIDRQATRSRYQTPTVRAPAGASLQRRSFRQPEPQNFPSKDLTAQTTDQTVRQANLAREIPAHLVQR